MTRADGRGVKLDGRLRVYDGRGRLLTEGRNRVVHGGLQALVDCLQGSREAGSFRYVAFGTSPGVTTDGTTALGAELAGGSYTRLTAAQTEGENDRQYRVHGTWQNLTGSSQTVREYGLWDSAVAGTLLARVSTGDEDGPAEQTVPAGGTLLVQWDIQLADG